MPCRRLINMSSGGVLVRLLPGTSNLDGRDLDRRLAALDLDLGHRDVCFASADTHRSGFNLERR